MIITRAPLRISFVGGGSDLPSYYEQADGAVVCMAINKYIYVTINPKFDDALRVSYSKTELVKKASELEHGLVRACLDHIGIKGGVEIVTIADIPSSGTGLGSSSSFTVALLHGLHAYSDRYVGKATLAEEACRMEIDICNAPIGKQDQYIAAYGGLNHITFKQDGSVDVTPIICNTCVVEELQENMLLLYTGRTRSASNILEEQSAKTREKKSVQDNLGRMVELAHELRKHLQAGKLDDFGRILHENWLLKRSLTEQISDSAIDAWYERARKAGALGGKILGAGGGGFLMLYAPKERHEAIKHALPELRHIPVALERNGSSVIFYQP